MSKITRINILPDSVDAGRPKHVPKSHEMNDVVPRCRPPGGKPPLPLDKSYNRQDGVKKR